MKVSFRHVAIAASIAALGYAGYAFAQSVYQTVTVPQSTDMFQITNAAPTNQFISAPNLARYTNSQELLFSSTATVAGAATTGEQTLLTYSLPGSSIQTGDVLRIKASFTASTDNNTKQWKCYFGSEVMGSPALVTNNKNGSCEVNVLETGTNTQIVYGNMLVDTTPVTGLAVTGAETVSSAIVIKLTGTQGTASAGDVMGNALTVERIGP